LKNKTLGHVFGPLKAEMREKLRILCDERPRDLHVQPFIFRTIIFRRPQWFRLANRKEENEFMPSAGRKVREKLLF
jgi:hypothetical protein